MRKILSIFVLLFVSASANAAAPVASCTRAPSGTITVGQLIFVDCTGTTDADLSGTQNRRLLVYKHRVTGDTGAKTVTYGTRAGAPKNHMTGFIAGYVPQAAGTLTWKTVVSDADGNVDTWTDTITVQAQTAKWGASATVCMTTGTDSAFCPYTTGEGATHRESITDIGSELDTYAVSNKRVVLKSGDSFARSTVWTCSNVSDVMVGTSGSEKATITGDNVTFLNLGSATPCSNIIIDNLNVTSTPDGDTGYFIEFGTTFTTGLTVTNTNASGMLGGWTVQGGESVYCDLCGMDLVKLTNMSNTSGGGATALFGFNKRLIVTDSQLGPFEGAAFYEHIIRLQPVQKGALTDLYVTGALGGKEEISIRARESGAESKQDSYDFYIADVHTHSTNDAYSIWIAPSNAGYGEDIYDAVVERVFMTRASSTGQHCFTIQASHIDIRNTICTSPNGAESWVVFKGDDLSTRGGTHPQTDVRFINNTFYTGKSDSGNGFILTWFLGSTTPEYAVLTNLLAYTPNITGTLSYPAGTPPTGYALTTSSTNTQIKTVNPFSATIDVADASTFVPITGTYTSGPPSSVINDGTATYPATGYFGDFYGCHSIAGNVRLGALVNRSDALCGQ